MGEEDRVTSSAAARCMNPSEVKQALSKLDKDCETRRTAMNSLKQSVQVMDATSVPRFLAQVSDLKEKGGTSRAYAISLYEDVARVHGKLIVPHIPRVMSTVTRSLSSSGSSPQLQHACANVLSAVAKHAIDESSPTQASDVLKELCNPLLDVLVGKLEPLAAGAAVCLQTLVESEQWKYASNAVVDDLCLKTTVALAERVTRTVAHMQLAISLAEANSSFLGSYGVALLRSGVEILKSPASAASWQQRASAGRLLTAVLPTVDRATLSEEFASTVQALENCKHDRISNVRSSVKEALKSARGVFSVENSRRSRDGEEPLAWLIGSPESNTSSPRRRSSCLGGGLSSDDVMSPPRLSNSSKLTRAAHRRGSLIPLPPAAPLDSRVVATRAGPPQSDVWPHRSPLRATSLHMQMGSHDASAVTSFNGLDSPRKENLPSKDPDTKMGTVEFDSEPSPSSTPTAGRRHSIACPPSARDAAFHHFVDMETSPAVTSKGRDESRVSPERLDVRINRDQQEGDFLAEDEEMFLFSKSVTPNSESRHEAGKFEMKTNSRDTKDSPSRSYHGVLDGSTMKHVFELKRPIVGSTLRNSARTLNVGENISVAVSPSKSISNWREPSNGLLGSPLKAEPPALLTTFEDSSSPENLKPLIGAEDFLSFTTPRRLVRSLQERFSSPPQPESPASRLVDEDVAKLREEDEFGDTMTTDMDLGTPSSTGTGWSVRTNPIASDESLRTDSDDSDHERGRAVWKKMVLESSTSPTPPAPNTPPAQETESPDINDGFRHRLDHPSSPAAAATIQADESAVSQLNRSVDFSSGSAGGESIAEVKPELFQQVEVIKRTQEVCSSSKITSEVGGLVTLLSGPADDNWRGEISSPRSKDESRIANAAAAHIEQGSDVTAAIATFDELVIGKEDLNRHLGQTLRDFFGWSQGRMHTLFRWQVCAVVVAIPIAIALSKVVFFPSDPFHPGYLAPT